MKKFRFTYSIPVIILLVLSALLTALGIVFNVINVISYYNLSTIKTVIYVLTLLVNIGLFILVISLGVNGCYVIKNQKLYSCFGLIKTKTDIFDVVSITYYKKTNKLVLFFKTAEYSSLLIAEKDYFSFVDQLKSINPSIIYDENSLSA